MGNSDPAISWKSLRNLIYTDL